MSYVTFLIKNEVIKIIEHQIHNSRFGELFYQCYVYNSIYISASRPNQSFNKYDFQKKSTITLLSEFSITA